MDTQLSVMQFSLFNTWRKSLVEARELELLLYSQEMSCRKKHHSSESGVVNK
jgi:hypothetical protein